MRYMSKMLPLYRQKNDWYKSVKISTEAIKELCEDNPYIYLFVGKNRYKSKNDGKPELIFFMQSGGK